MDYSMVGLEGDYMKDDISINEFKLGMMLIDKNNKKYIVIETDLNGEDDYWSRLKIVSEEEYVKNRNKSVTDGELKTSKWIDKFDYKKEFDNCDGICDVHIEKRYVFG